MRGPASLLARGGGSEMVDAQRDGRPDVGSAERPDRAAPPDGGGRVPWRVEGARRDGGEGPQRPRLFGPRFWLLLLGLLVLNWVLSGLLGRAPAGPGGARRG